MARELKIKLDLNKNVHEKVPIKVAEDGNSATA
jgi:hypothetical protein